jgi:hypothetical protein
MADSDRFGIVVGTKAEAQAIIDVIDRELGYPRTVVGKRVTVTTTTHGAPLKHPTIAGTWAVVLDWQSAAVAARAWITRTNRQQFPLTRLGPEWFPAPTNPF